MLPGFLRVRRAVPMPHSSRIATNAAGVFMHRLLNETVAIPPWCLRR
jgi:hypothetical protein